MKIHHVLVGHEDRYVMDPQVGPVKRREVVLSASDVDRIVHDGKTYEVGPDGTFDVPEDVAQFMTRMPGWYTGPSPFPPEQPEPRKAARPKKVTDL